MKSPLKGVFERVDSCSAFLQVQVIGVMWRKQHATEMMIKYGKTELQFLPLDLRTIHRQAQCRCGRGELVLALLELLHGE